MSRTREERIQAWLDGNCSRPMTPKQITVDRELHDTLKLMARYDAVSMQDLIRSLIPLWNSARSLS